MTFLRRIYTIISSQRLAKGRLTMNQEYQLQKIKLKEEHQLGNLTDRQYLAQLCLLAWKHGNLQFVKEDFHVDL